MPRALAGKDATFAVTVKAVEAPGSVTIDDEFAKTLGLESLAKLKDAIKERIAREHAAASRQKLKRALLDQLDERHKFEPPPSLVEQEFKNVWSQIESDLKQQNRTFADEGTTEEKAREEYRAIAERRVRLGLVLAEIGEKNNIKVTDEQLRPRVMEQVRQFPGRERQIWDYYQKNPSALAACARRLFEDKVVDFLVELAEVTEKPVSREELFKEDEEGWRIGVRICAVVRRPQLGRIPKLSCRSAPRETVSRLVAGSSAHICDSCIAECAAVLESMTA